MLATVWRKLDSTIGSSDAKDCKQLDGLCPVVKDCMQFDSICLVIKNCKQMLICSQSFIIEETKETITTRNRTICLLIAYSLLVKQELRNHRFDIHSTAMQLMDNNNSRIIDLTGDDQSVAEFVDLSKTKIWKFLTFVLPPHQVILPMILLLCQVTLWLICLS